MQLIVPAALLEQMNLSSDELLLEVAVYLYDTERLTMGQAKKLAGLSQIQFQQELAKRNVAIKYGVEDLEKDLENLRSME